MKTMLSILLLVSISVIAKSQKTDSVRYKTYLEVTLSNGKNMKLFDGDSIVNAPDSSVNACIKVLEVNSNVVYEPSSFDAIFIIFSREPYIVPRQNCLKSEDLEHYNRLMNSIGDQLHVRNVKIKNGNGGTVSVPPLWIRGNEKE